MARRHALGRKAGLPGLVIGFSGAILRTASMAGYFPAHRRRTPLQTFGYIKNRRTRSALLKTKSQKSMLIFLKK
jgi:hypothetical protein